MGPSWGGQGQVEHGQKRNDATAPSPYLSSQVSCSFSLSPIHQATSLPRRNASKSSAAQLPSTKSKRNLQFSSYSQEREEGALTIFPPLHRSSTINFRHHHPIFPFFFCHLVVLPYLTFNTPLSTKSEQTVPFWVSRERVSLLLTIRMCLLSLC